jgi:uncharacterized protein
MKRDIDRIPKNVLGGPLQTCCTSSITGFYRDGCCNTGDDDPGQHVVCAQVTAEFLAFSKARGNDLSTPQVELGFPGLKPGDRWCLCAARWMEALDADVAPRIVLTATHESMLEYLTLEDLKKFALDLN